MGCGWVGCHTLKLLHLDPLFVAIYSSIRHRHMDTNSENNPEVKQKHIFSLKVGRDLYENVLKKSNEHLLLKRWMERTDGNDDGSVIEFKINTREQALRFISYMVKQPGANRADVLGRTKRIGYRRKDLIAAGEDPNTLNLEDRKRRRERFLPLVLAEALEAITNFSSENKDEEVDAMCRAIGDGSKEMVDELEEWDKALSSPDFDGAWVFAIDSLTDSGFVAATGKGLNDQGRGVLRQNNTKITDDSGRLPCFLVAPLGVSEEAEGQGEMQLLFTTALLAVYAEDQRGGGSLLRKMSDEYAHYTTHNPKENHSEFFMNFAGGGVAMAEFEKNPLDWARNNQSFTNHIGDFLEWAGGHSDFPCFRQKGQTGKQHIAGYPPKVMTKMRDLAKDPRSGFAYFEPDSQTKDSSYLDAVVKSLEARRTEEQREFFGKKRKEWIGKIKRGSPDFLNLIMGEGVVTKDGEEVTVIDNETGEPTKIGVDELVRTLGPAIDPEENGLQDEERDSVEKTLKSLVVFRAELESQGIHVELEKISSISDFSRFLLERNKKNKEEGESIENLEKALNQYKKPEQSPLEKHQGLDDLCGAVTQVLSEELKGLGKGEQKILRELVFNGAKTEQTYGMMRFPDGTLKFGKANDYSLRVVDLVRDGGTFAPFVVWVSKGLAVGNWDTSLLQQVASNDTFLKGLVGEQPVGRGNAKQSKNGGRTEITTAFGFKNDKSVPDNVIDFVIQGLNNFCDERRSEDPNFPDLSGIALGSKDDVLKKLEKLVGKGWAYGGALPELANLLCTWRAFNDDESGAIGPVEIRDAVNEAIIGIGLVQAGVPKDKYKKMLGDLAGAAKNNDGKLGATPENRAMFYKYRRQYGSYQVEHLIHKHLEPYKIPGTEIFPGMGVVCVDLINRLDEVLPSYLKHSKKIIIDPSDVQRVAREAESPYSLPLIMTDSREKEREFCRAVRRGLTVSNLCNIVDDEKKLTAIQQAPKTNGVGANGAEFLNYVFFGAEDIEQEKKIIKHAKSEIKLVDGEANLYSIIATGLRMEEFSERSVKGGLVGIGKRIHKIFTNGGGYAGFGKASWGKIVEHGTGLCPDIIAGAEPSHAKVAFPEKTGVPVELLDNKEIKEALLLKEKGNSEETRKEARRLIAKKLLEKVELPEGGAAMPTDYKTKIINRLTLWGCLPFGSDGEELQVKKNNLQEKCGDKEENRRIVQDGFGSMCHGDHVWLIFDAIQKSTFSPEESVILNVLSEVGTQGVGDGSVTRKREENRGIIRSANWSAPAPMRASLMSK